MAQGLSRIWLTSSSLASCLLVIVIFLRHIAATCNFPSSLHMDHNDPPWCSHVRDNKTCDVEYYIRHSVMEIHYPQSNQPSVRWKCSMNVQGKTMLKRQDHLVNSFYRCVQFVFRSRSVVQILWSHELKTFDLGLCDDLNLIPDPWPLIWYRTVEEDYTPCPFSGGFDMKIVDSQYGENGCNLMLRPMRMEAECLAGEGVTFDFVSNNCLPEIKMYVKQRTICVTEWHDSKNHYIVLRRNEELDLWCLVMPLRRAQNVTAYLYSDLACMSDTDRSRSNRNIKFFTLHLHTRTFPTICEDEYDQCRKVTCNKHVKQECQKSCGMCDSSSAPRDCEYPTNFQGKWFLKDSYGYKNIAISGSNFSIDGVGNYKCVSYPNSPPRKSTVYTSISLFHNGCRPRYTCVKFNPLGTSVLQFSLSHSFIWPIFDNNVIKSICNDNRFHADSSPLNDRYLSHEGSGKPIISRLPKTEPVRCNLTFVHTINATLPEGYICPGSLYQHCEDPTKLRLDFDTCGSLIPESRDYKCLVNFEGHYWERILLVQNVHDEMDAICFVFSQFYPIESYVLVASQCDQKSFNFARIGLRQPVLKFTFRTEQETCKNTSHNPRLPVINLAESSTGTGNSERGVNNADLDSRDSGSISSGSHLAKIGHAPDSGLYNDLRGKQQVPSAKSTTLDRANLLRSGEDNNRATSLNSYIVCVLLTASLVTL